MTNFKFCPHCGVELQPERLVDRPKDANTFPEVKNIMIDAWNKAQMPDTQCFYNGVEKTKPMGLVCNCPKCGVRS